MVKRLAASLTLATSLTASAAAPSAAQALQRLTVTSFELSSDAASPRAETPFHLILSLRVRQRVAQIENLNLPLLAQLELLGDERATTSGPSGTQYRESITVVAHSAASITIAPATLQAIDARDGKAKQWFTNTLTLRVAGAPPEQALRSGVVTAARLIAWLVLAAFALAVVALVALLAARRRAAPPAMPAQEPVLVPMRPRSRKERVEDALTVLRRERTRRAAVTVRSAIWRMLGASEGETLGDVLRRPDASEPAMRALLISLERSAFTYDHDLQPAIDDACSALERYIGEAS